MNDDPIIEELHRHREELFRECGNDPEALLRYLQEKERNSGRTFSLHLRLRRSGLALLRAPNRTSR
jgi:hypothetical protein